MKGLKVGIGLPNSYEASHKYVPRKEWELLDFETMLPQAVEELLAQHK